MYYYIAKSDINQAAAYAAMGDVFDETELMYVKKVNVSTFMMHSILSYNFSSSFFIFIGEIM